MIKRRTFLKVAAGAAVFAVPALVSGCKASSPDTPERKITETAVSKAKVYFTDDISPEGLLKVYQKINENVKGRVAIKWHSGEPNGPNLVPVPMVKALQQSIPNSALVETNVYYNSPRKTTEGHREVLKTNGWTFCEVDIMDEDGAVMLPIKGGKHFKEMSMGKNILKYDSMVVLSHLKGHASGGFGGAIKNIAIGNADGKVGKKMQHTFPGQGQWSVSGERFMEHMVEAAKASTDHFGNRIVYINVMRNMSVDCDCMGVAAASPKARDVGILASTDIVAIDQASVDLVYQLPKEETHDLRERIESRHGLHQLTYGAEIGIGTRQYELIAIK
ncbi:MAG: DUF362 domain-containing protein [Burkholderiales bacterium]|nr:DUF362 domain-containing protein [Burkholderiales bacterium]